MKRLLFLLVFTLFFFSLFNTSVLAKNVGRCNAGSAVESAPFAPGTVTGLTVDCADEAVCFQISSSGEAGCYKAAAAPAAGAAGTTGAGSGSTTNTSGGGKPCTDGTGAGIATAIGCIPTEPRELINGLLRFGTFAAGGIAFLLMILASLEMITAEGSAEVIKKAQEKFYSAIIGLLFIIFAVLLMQIIGVDILSLPGFKP